MSNVIQNYSDENDVDNVVVYIADSLRYDAVPETTQRKGVFGKAIAGSTHTASGYPTILTGKYPASHSIWSLNQALSDKPRILKRANSGVDATTVWENVDNESNKPPLSICRLESSTKLEDLDEPFVLFVHDIGGHAVYGGKRARNKWQTPADQIADLCDDKDGLKERYHKGVKESLDRFSSICSELSERNLIDNTLVILTSDHGELLGEYSGMFGHGVPLVPELVEVPILFTGAGINDSANINSIISTADVVPTALGALGESIPSELDGKNLWSNHPGEDRVIQSHVWKQTRYPLVEYKSSSIWDESGGIVVQDGNVLTRMIHGIGTHALFSPYCPIFRSNLPNLELWRRYGKRLVTYDDTNNLNESDIISPDKFVMKEGRSDQVQGPTREQLRDLGYIE